MSLVIVLNEEELIALGKILAACDDAFDEDDERDASVMAAVRLLRDRLDAAIADRELDERQHQAFLASLESQE